MGAPGARLPGRTSPFMSRQPSDAPPASRTSTRMVGIDSGASGVSAHTGSPGASTTTTAASGPPSPTGCRSASAVPSGVVTRNEAAASTPASETMANGGKPSASAWPSIG